MSCFFVKGDAYWQLRENLPQFLDVLLTKTVTPPTKLAVALGHVVGVALRLKYSPKSKVEPGRDLIEQKKVSFCSFK